MDWATLFWAWLRASRIDRFFLLELDGLTCSAARNLNCSAHFECATAADMRLPKEYTEIRQASALQDWGARAHPIAYARTLADARTFTQARPRARARARARAQARTHAHLRTLAHARTFTHARTRTRSHMRTHAPTLGPARTFTNSLTLAHAHRFCTRTQCKNGIYRAAFLNAC
eukprot:6182907-Pleurochrysis_carterae.AAC.1